MPISGCSTHSGKPVFKPWWPRAHDRMATGGLRTWTWVGQTNMTEHDPVVLDIEQWADYWASLQVDAVLVSVRRVQRRGQEARPASDRAHESGSELGRRRRRLPGVVPARLARQRHTPRRRCPPVPYVHVHGLHDRLVMRACRAIVGLEFPRPGVI